MMLSKHQELGWLHAKEIEIIAEEGKTMVWES